MNTARTQKSNMQHPSKYYTKYKSQSKTNPLLNKLQQDAGYPQDIFNQKSTISIKKFGFSDKDYLQQNKKNLKNFFADRIPQQNIQIFRESFQMDPSKLFQIRKRQHQLKASTRQKLEQKLSTTHTNSTKINPNKISQIFFLNDKNQDFKKKFLGNNSVRITLPYQQGNYLRGTTSYMKKYSKITKKQAYNSVFGVEASATSRNSARTSSKTYRQHRPATFHTSRNNKQLNVVSKSKQLQRKKFSSLIQKIDKHRQNLDPENRFGFKPYVIPAPMNNQQQIKSDMITWIKDTVKRYKFNTIDMFMQKIKDIEDINKIDEKYYNQMIEHKARRLQNRSLYVQDVSTLKQKVEQSSINNNQRSNKKFTPFLSSKKQKTQNLSVSSQSSDNYSISSSQRSQSDDGVAGVRSTIALLRRFARALVDALQQARYYGIENKQNIYKAFWKNPAPYEKSGSYAFFKSVKRGDLDGVKKFLANDTDYVYERDHKGRSALIYAAQNNHTNVVQHIMSCDVNVNQRAFNYKTSLYYAIKNQNVALVKKLLQSGAIPWSFKGCSYKKILQKVNNSKINTLFKNARKVSIALKMLVGRTAKMNLWRSLKEKIDQNLLIY